MSRRSLLHILPLPLPLLLLLPALQVLVVVTLLLLESVQQVEVRRLQLLEDLLSLREVMVSRLQISIRYLF